MAELLMLYKYVEKYVDPYIPDGWSIANAKLGAINLIPTDLRVFVVDLAIDIYKISDLIFFGLIAFQIFSSWSQALRRPNRKWILFSVFCWILALGVMFWMQTLMFVQQKNQYDNQIRLEGLIPTPESDADFVPLVVPNFKYQYSPQEMTNYLSSFAHFGREVYATFIFIDFVAIMAASLFHRQVLSIFYPFGDPIGTPVFCLVILFSLVGYFENFGTLWMITDWPNEWKFEKNPLYALRVTKAGSMRFSLMLILFGLEVAGIVRYFLGIIDYKESEKAIANADAEDLKRQEEINNANDILRQKQAAVELQILKEEKMKTLEDIRNKKRLAAAASLAIEEKTQK